MNTIKIENKKCKIIAHRGLSGLECENTNAAFVAAGNRSYFGIETDVHVTKDGKYIIIHDNSTKRVSDKEFDVEKSRYKKLKKVRLYDKVDKRFRSDLSLPDLTDYIRICKKYEKTAVLELKNPMSDKEIVGIINEISGEDYLENTIFISFDWDNLVKIKSNLPEQRVQFLTSKWDDELIDKLKKYNMDLDIAYSAVTEELVRKLHENNIEINCWTCDEKEDAEKLIEYGVDYITSNILE